MTWLKIVILVLFLSTVATITFSQSTFPNVFITGEYPEAFEKLNTKYSGSLISASGNDMDVAFNNWRLFLSDIEKYSEEIKFDLKGVKIMLQVYWNKNGKIDHLTYWPKPECKNIPEEDLVAFFKSFVRNYSYRVKSNENFTHSGAAEFPTMGIFLEK